MRIVLAAGLRGWRLSVTPALAQAPQVERTCRWPWRRRSSPARSSNARRTATRSPAVIVDKAGRSPPPCAATARIQHDGIRADESLHEPQLRGQTSLEFIDGEFVAGRRASATDPGTVAIGGGVRRSRPAPSHRRRRRISARRAAKGRGSAPRRYRQGRRRSRNKAIPKRPHRYRCVRAHFICAGLVRAVLRRRFPGIDWRSNRRLRHDRPPLALHSFRGRFRRRRPRQPRRDGCADQPGANAALIVVDVQNCFRPAARWPLRTATRSFRSSTSSRNLSAISSARRTGTAGHVSFASSHAGKKPFDVIKLGYGDQVLWPDHCVQGTEGAALAKDLQLPTAQLVIRKGFSTTTSILFGVARGRQRRRRPASPPT